MRGSRRGGSKGAQGTDDEGTHVSPTKFWGVCQHVQAVSPTPPACPPPPPSLSRITPHCCDSFSLAARPHPLPRRPQCSVRFVPHRLPPLLAAALSIHVRESDAVYGFDSRSKIWALAKTKGGKMEWYPAEVSLNSPFPFGASRRPAPPTPTLASILAPVLLCGRFCVCPGHCVPGARTRPQILRVPDDRGNMTVELEGKELKVWSLCCLCVHTPSRALRSFCGRASVC